MLLIIEVGRYILFDTFHFSVLTIFIFPVVSFVIYLLSKRFARQERSYQPKNIESWSFYHLQNVLLNQKPLFKGEEKRGYVKRYFTTKWQYVVADVISMNWYLSLEIQLDDDIYNVRWYRKKRFSTMEHWYIYKNGKQIGDAYTEVNVGNAVKLKEVLKLRVNDTVYISSAISVNSNVSLTKNEIGIGTLKRNHILSNVKVIDVEGDEQESILALILHSYAFSK